MFAAIVPAAGESSRFPWFKLTYVYHDKPLVAQTVENIALSNAVDLIVIVTGYKSEEVRDALRDWRELVSFVHNPRYREGMSSSIRAGAEYLMREFGDIEGLFVNPADAAWIHPGVYALVKCRLMDSGKGIAIAAYQGARGHPIAFRGDLLGEVAEITEAEMGLKGLVNRHRENIILVETGYPGVLLDLDNVLDILRVKLTIKK